MFFAVSIVCFSCQKTRLLHLIHLSPRTFKGIVMRPSRLILVACTLLSQEVRLAKAFGGSPCCPSLRTRSRITRRLSSPVSKSSLIPRNNGKHIRLRQGMDGSDHQEQSNVIRVTKAVKSVWDYLQRKPQGQGVVVAFLYLFHLTVLTQREVVFPVQLLPNRKGLFTGIGLDSLAGIATLIVYRVFRHRHSLRQSVTSASSPCSLSDLPSLASTPTPTETPWNLPRDSPRHRLTAFVTSVVLVQAYFATGRFSIFWEDTLYAMSGLGFFITAPMQRSLCVLLGHLSWLVLGALLLRWLPRPPKFFQPANHHHQKSRPLSSRYNEKDGDVEEVVEDEASRPSVWFRSSRQSRWLWWVIGGYCVSSWLFNIADLANQYILPESVLEDAQESVVSQLVNPEHNDWLASIVGYVAPCITAPWWEEVLYRGFALPGLTQLFGYRWAVFLQGIIFSAHHMSLPAALPLAVLGWTWAVLYTKSKNLWVVVAVHALWNSRVFLGSWLGL